MLGTAREVTMRPKVYSVAIELTAFCNQKCDYCYNEWREDGGQKVSTGDRKTLVARVSRLVSALDIDHVTLTGGEPFAHPGVFDVLDVLAEHRLRAYFISNGGIVTDAIAKRLAPYAPLGVQITLNGPDAALHEAHVGHIDGLRSQPGFQPADRHLNRRML